MHDMSHKSLFNFGWSAERVRAAGLEWLVPLIIRRAMEKLAPNASVKVARLLYQSPPQLLLIQRQKCYKHLKQ